jgi:hypothetical protein
MRRSVAAIAIGFGLTVVLFVIGGMAGSACHCMTPMTVFFPYGTAVSMSGEWETVGLLLITAQWPLYGWLLTNTPAGGKRLIVLILLAVVHAAAVMFWLYF